MVPRLATIATALVLTACTTAEAGSFYISPFIKETRLRSNTDFETGILQGAALSINADPTKFDLSVGRGVVVDKSDPERPAFRYVDVAARTAIADAFITSDTTWVLIDKNDVLSQTNVEPTPAQRRENIVVGSLVKSVVGGVIILAVNNRTPAYGGLKTFEDQLYMLGGMGSGAILSANSDLSLDISAGQIISVGRGLEDTPESPNTVITPAQTPIPTGRIFRSYEGASGSVVIDASSNQLDPNNYNNVGTLTAVPAGKYTIQRCFLFPETDVLAVYYGNSFFDTLLQALEQIETEAWTEHPDTRAGAFRGWIIVQQGTTDLAGAIAADPQHAAIINAGPLRPDIVESSGVPTIVVTADLSSSVDQKPGTTNPTVVTFNTENLLDGLAHGRPEDIEALTATPLSVIMQYQLERLLTGTDLLWHGWVRKGRRDGDITDVAIGNPAVIESAGHRIQTNQTVTIQAGCTTSASITGTHTATFVDANHFSVPVNVTSVTDGTCSWTRALDVLDDVPNSNLEVNLQTQDQTAVVTSPLAVFPEEHDVLNVMQSVSNAIFNAGLAASTPSGEPAIPSVRIVITAGD